MSLAPVTEANKVRATLSTMTIPVDYNDVNAVDPDPGIVLWSQNAVDDFLAGKGATNFKHLQAVWDALPYHIEHEITIQLAAGIHRPLSNPSASFAWELGGKLVNADIYIDGTLPSTWPGVDLSLEDLTVDSAQLASGDPWIDVSSSHPNAFQGFDLKGRFAVFSTGQVAVIHDHTDDRLFLCTSLSPTPVGGTVTVARPATILRDSLDDATATHTGLLLSSSKRSRPRNIRPRYQRWQKFSIQGVTFIGDHGALALNLDYDIENNMANLTGMSAQQSAVVSVIDSSIRATPGVFDPDSMFRITFKGTLFLNGSYFRGFEDPIIIYENGTMQVRHSVFDEVGATGVAPSSIFVQNASLQFHPSFGGKITEIRSLQSGVGGVLYGPGAVLQPSETPTAVALKQEVGFRNLSGPCVQVEGATIDITPRPGISGSAWLDLGGNTDVGIALGASGASVRIPTSVTVTGTIGDIRMADGTIVSYSDLDTYGAYMDDRGNTVGR